MRFLQVGRPLASVAVAVVLLCAAPIHSRAGITFYNSHGAFQNDLNALGITDYNVMFNGSGVVNGPALTVTGVTNQGGLLVNISSTEMLTGVGGQSPAVRPVDGNTPNLTVALQDPNKFMQSLIFNLHNEGNQTTSTVKLTATDQFGQTSFTEIVNNGENWMGMIGTGGSFITNASVQVLSSSTGSTDVLDQMNQIRVSAVTSTGGPIPGPPGGSGGGAGGLETPLPGSWLLWSALTAGLLFWWGASKRRPALAGAA